MRKILAKRGIPETILDQWEERFGGRLLPLQYRAVEEYHLLEGTSLLISAPTSSGKTFCGEMALVRAVQQRKKGIFLVPLKAVAEEKYRHFRGCYGDLGLRTVIATRDHSDNDGAIENGRFDIAVMIYEKFNSLLLTNFDLMSQVGALVIDELQMLEDEKRGAHLELALTKLLYSDHNPQLVALSAVLGEATGLAEWLGCRVLLEKTRPVELKRGIASEGRFYFRCHNTGEVGEEKCRSGEDTNQTLFENVREACVSGKQVLVFLKSRRETMQAARKFAEYARLEAKPECRDFFDKRLADEEESSLLYNLRSLLAAGAAFHNSDLTGSQRLAVEEGYRAGFINVIFATTTLSTGINLPAAMVLIEAQKYSRQKCSGRPGLQPLSWSEYESMSGRAGRIGMMGDEATAGRAVLLASGELEKSILWEYYIDQQPSPLTSQLPAKDTSDILVDLFSSGLVSSLEDAVKILECSYAQSCNTLLFNDMKDKYKALLDKSFLVKQGNSIIATPLGKAVSRTGLSITGADYILRKSPLPESGSDCRILYSVFHSPEGKVIHIPTIGHRERVFQSEWFSNMSDPLVRELTSMQREFTADEISRLKLVFLMRDWMEGMPAADLENIYHLYPGMIENLGYQVGWLLASIASIIKASDRCAKLPRRLNDLALAARTGLPCRMKRLYGVFKSLLFRSEWLALYTRGITDRQGMINDGLTVLRAMVSSEARLKKIENCIQKIKEDPMQLSSQILLDSPARPESIEIDGTPVRERFRIRINGHPINLTGKSFKYLLRLVWSRLTNDAGWLYKEDLERGFNQARYLYRLRQEIGRDFMPEWPLYENNRSGYYRLAADRDGLKVNVDALKEIPDFEIQQMALDLKALTSN